MEGMICVSDNRCASFASTRKPATPPATHTTCRRGTETGKGERDTNPNTKKHHNLSCSIMASLGYNLSISSELNYCLSCCGSVLLCNGRFLETFPGCVQNAYFFILLIFYTFSKLDATNGGSKHPPQMDLLCW